MQHWLDALATLSEAAVLVTVAAVEGSAPRAAGAKMVVTPERTFDTVGGGHLELRACDIARAMLARPERDQRGARWLERFSLGPSLGQCCGGVVYLAFERIEPARARAYLDCLGQRWRKRQDTWRLLALDADGADAAPTLCDGAGMRLAGPAAALHARFDGAQPCYLMRDAAGRRWLVDACLAPRPLLLLFGAGHVGAAIVRALADLPCRVIWVDQRADLFPAALPANVQVEATDLPEAVVDAAPSGASYLVMTHSHALDQRLCEAILRRADVAWFGLIGSHTKRRQFEHRLRERGIAAPRLAGMVCPIGLPGIGGKTPAVIAASVSAQLLQVWEQIELAGRRDLGYRLLHAS